MARKRKGDKIDGWINLDKPPGLTSTQAMAKVRWLMKAQKAGHAGTLDPLATGILPIALGEATKTISYIQDGLKTYSFTVQWGEQRDTDDLEGKIIETSDARPTKEQIESVLPRYIGEIRQTPPKFSAIKIDGARAYDLARDGEEVELKERGVYIESLEIINSSSLPRQGSMGNTDTKSHQHKGEGMDASLRWHDGLEETSFRMVCGKGTYVRALARDLGREMGCLGYITALKREKVGPFTLESAISLDKLAGLDDIARLNEAVLLPLETALDDIPALAVTETAARRLRHGQVVPLAEAHGSPPGDVLSGRTDPTVAILHEGRLVAIASFDGRGLKPERVFNT